MIKKYTGYNLNNNEAKIKTFFNEVKRRELCDKFCDGFPLELDRLISAFYIYEEDTIVAIVDNGMIVGNKFLLDMYEIEEEEYIIEEFVLGKDNHWLENTRFNSCEECIKIGTSMFKDEEFNIGKVEPVEIPHIKTSDIIELLNSKLGASIKRECIDTKNSYDIENSINKLLNDRLFNSNYKIVLFKVINKKSR